MKNEFRGKFEIVDIGRVKPNSWNPKEPIDQNSTNKSKFEEIKENISKKKLYLPIIVRELQESQEYEIIDGYHRFLACKELNYETIMIWNLGHLANEEAQGITLDSIYLQIQASEVMIAHLIKKMKANIPDVKEMLKILPYKEDTINEYLHMANFDWEKIKQEGNKELPSKEVECPECGAKFNI